MNFLGFCRLAGLGVVALAIVGCNNSSSSSRAVPADVSVTETEAARFLTQATFGPTTEEIDQVADLGGQV